MELEGTKTKERGTLRRWQQSALGGLWSQGGSLLVETVLVLGVFGILGTAVLSGVQTSYTSKRQFDSQSTAENIVRNQMEYVFEQPYVPPPGTYLTITPPDGYSVTAEALDYNGDPNVETVRVTVYHQGQPVKLFETLRANR